VTAKGTITGTAAPNRIDLTGQRFGRLIAGESKQVQGKTQKKLHYACKCDCGEDVLVVAQNLRRGLTESCGCLQKDRAKQASLKHGMSHTSIHNTWMSMLQRCNDSGCKAYKDYGGRGVKVCERWLEFNNFYADMGLPPQKGMTLDRYPNNDGNYESGNVRWATAKEQANNRRSSCLLTYDGETMTVAQWEDRRGFRRGLIHCRLQMGWTPERAITQKPRFDQTD